MSAMSAKLDSVKTSIRHNRHNEPSDGVFRNCYKVLGLLNIRFRLFTYVPGLVCLTGLGIENEQLDSVRVMYLLSSIHIYSFDTTSQ